jgi:hypothetical protein
MDDGSLVVAILVGGRCLFYGDFVTPSFASGSNEQCHGTLRRAYDTSIHDQSSNIHFVEQQQKRFSLSGSCYSGMGQGVVPRTWNFPTDERVTVFIILFFLINAFLD